ncbi:DNA-3-methyladenine glycosylase family protein [Streptomyces indicus]|uniref:3-methyladenine DNA glycosylase/8-oxoguanine DNA glycosylase n=1 Tax=Streptomyces indicus TaxID=417292 RepID=A0A1G9I355_9ACTN|nr:DNA-3-methyladenine glycosylase [Streptomyces indicus]SDL19661.1 3-methyladenine DNA glycosylase/8-oxoguanine DNA glycosylase [Streptomyces indicus]
MAGRFEPRAQRLNRTTVRAGDTRLPRPARAPRSARAHAAPARTRTWTPTAPFDLGLVVGPLRRGPADPTFRVTNGTVWRATRTPEGPATLRLTRSSTGIEAAAWGEGADWLLDRLPHLLGDTDDPGAFTPRHRLVADSHRRRPGLRLLRTGLVMESLIPSVLEQKVTTDEAYRAWRILVRKYGEQAPGPDGMPDLYVMPEPATWRMIPSWDWHRAGVDNKRAQTILRAVRVAPRLEEAVALDPQAARKRLELVPGIGPWTSAETVQRTHGAPDEVTVGDLHLPGIVGYALAGERDADDARMLELLEPYRGQRHRAARYILLTGRTPPRRTPKMPKTDIGKL